MLKPTVSTHLILAILCLTVSGALAVVTASTPVPRQIIQRNSEGFADIPVAGSYSGPAVSIEARAVVMTGPADNGTTTPWTIVDASPINNTFSGVLANVPQGGWYQIEFRKSIGGSFFNGETVERVGVGDIYLVAGQSNAANFGDPVLDPMDDRLSERTRADLNTWKRASDPFGITRPDRVNDIGRTGTLASTWTRLGPLLTASEDVPIGFLVMALGNSKVNEYRSDANRLFYIVFISDGVKSFPPNGFKAFLWHQGERDANIATSFADYKSDLESMISGSRADAGWNIPWYIAEAAYQSSSNLSQEETIKAAQRSVAADDPFTFLGASTDEFHLEDVGDGKIFAGVHFNAAGLADHAAQWHAILTGNTDAEILNPSFELNTDPAITRQKILMEDEAYIVKINNDDGDDNDNDVNKDVDAGASPSVIDWRIMSSSGIAAADGDNGFFNPGMGTYGTAIPTGVSGVNAATLSGGTGGNHFLQAIRYLTKPARPIKLTAAIGLRSSGGTYGNAQIELRAGNTILASRSITAAELTAGEFTDFDIMGSASGSAVGEELTVIITKKDGGTDTYVDFDNLRLEVLPSVFEQWLAENSLTQPDGDPDGDGRNNLLEFAFDSDPNLADVISSPLSIVGESFNISRRIGSVNGLVYTLERSTSLLPESWTPVTDVMTNFSTIDGLFESVNLSPPGGLSADEGAVFYRLSVELQ